MLTNFSPTPTHHAIIRSADLQPSTQTKYIAEIDRLIQAGIDPRNRQALATYSQGLSNSSRSFLKAALRLLSAEHVTNLKASATADNLPHVQAQLYNIEAMTKTIQVKASKGEKAHIWLSPAQVEEITALPDRSTVKGMRDYIILSVMLGAGLRRDELVHLTFDQIKQQPTKDGFRTVLSITGKGNKDRIIPINNKLAAYLRQWFTLTGPGHVARSISKAGNLGESLSEIGIHNIVRRYGALIGIPQLDSHDLRRTYAQIGYNSGVPITQISKLLGHSDVRTTQRYLNLDIDLEQTASDFIPLSGD